MTFTAATIRTTRLAYAIAYGLEFPFEDFVIRRIGKRAANRAALLPLMKSYRPSVPPLYFQLQKYYKLVCNHLCYWDGTRVPGRKISFEGGRYKIKDLEFLLKHERWAHELGYIHEV